MLIYSPKCYNIFEYFMMEFLIMILSGLIYEKIIIFYLCATIHFFEKKQLSIMALSNFVYISNVNNLSDARYAAGMGVNLLGFRLDPKDEASLNPAQFSEISEWISGVKIVGEFGDSNPQEIKASLDQFAVDYLLVSDESQIHDFSMIGIPLIFRLEITNENKQDLESTMNFCVGTVEYFLLESKHENVNEADVNLITELATKYPIIMGYGVDTGNAKTIVGDLHLKGISLKGSPELRPGYKDFDEMADILEALEID